MERLPCLKDTHNRFVNANTSYINESYIRGEMLPEGSKVKPYKNKRL